MTPRRDGRAADELREINLHTGFVKTATGSALIEAGGTRVICTASVDEDVPRWMVGQGRGWVTAEYGMLPASTGERKKRDVAKGRPDGRTVEIQRLIGRPLRRDHGRLRGAGAGAAQAGRRGQARAGSPQPVGGGGLVRDRRRRRAA